MRAQHLVTPEALDAFLQGFEACTLDKSEWTHAAHVAAGGAYLYDSQNLDVASVLPLVRERICAFNLSIGGANTQTSGYHETLTHFWLLVIARHLQGNSAVSRLDAARKAVAAFGEQSALHNEFYSGDVVKDTTARQSWRSPDKRSL